MSAWYFHWLLQGFRARKTGLALLDADRSKLNDLLGISCSFKNSHHLARRYVVELVVEAHEKLALLLLAELWV